MQSSSWMQKTTRLTAATGIAAGLMAATALPTWAASFTLEENLLFGETSEVVFSLDSAEAIDGLEVSGTLTGVPVSDLEVEVFGESGLQVVSEEFSENSFSVILAPTELAQSVSLSTETPLFVFRFVPDSPGDIFLTLDSESTLVAGSESEGNIFSGDTLYEFTVPDTILDEDSGMIEVDPTAEAALENEVTSPSFFHPGTLIIGVLTVLVALVGGLAWWRNSRRAKAPMPEVAEPTEETDPLRDRPLGL